MVKVTGAFQKSTEIMKTTNQLMKLPQLSASMRELSMEMMKVSPQAFSAFVPCSHGAVTDACAEWHHGRDDGGNS